jgi:hypothetical protein
MDLKTYEERQAEERKELERRRARLNTIAAGLIKQPAFAGFTGKHQNDMSYEPALDLKHADGRTLYLSTTRHEKAPRLYVAGRYPHDSKGRYVEVRNAPRISIALDREIADIGKDIARRFLPDYQARFNEVYAQVEKQNERHKKLLWVGKRLAERLDARFDPDRVDGDVHLTEYRPERISVRTYDGERFSLDVELTSEAQLNQILDILKPRKEGH